MLKLNQFQSLSYQQMPISTMPGDLLIQLDLNESVLKNNLDCQHYYINFLLNYYNAFYSKDNNYHLEFQLCYFELLPQFIGHNINTQQRGYKLKNLMENYTIKSTFDQLISITTYKEMYFLYIIMLSRRKCYILDSQLHPQIRFSDHEKVAKTILNEFNIYYSDLQCFLLKEVKQDPPILLRAGLLLDFIYKYIDEENDVERIENIKIRSSDAKKIFDKINWFVFKCYTDKIYIAKEPPPRPKYMDKLLTYDEWKESITQNSFDKIQKMKNQFQSNLKESKIQFNDLNKSSFSILSLIGQTQVNQSNSFSSSKSAININAQSFFEQQQIKSEIPKVIKHQTVSEQQQGINKQEIENLLKDAKQQIRKEILQELQIEQEERMKLYEKKIKNQYNPIDEQIAQEYLAQIKFQRYKEYLDYLMEYYYNNDKNEYYKLIDEYNQRLKDTALNGLIEVQKQEMVKLQTITKQRIYEQNQQLETALFNQKKDLQHLFPVKKQIEHEQKMLELQKPQNQSTKHQYKFQFANVNPIIDPYEFRLDQDIDLIRKEKTKLDEIELSQSEIDKIEQVWKPEVSSSSNSIYNYDEELEKLQQLYGKNNKSQGNYTKRTPNQSIQFQSSRQFNPSSNFEGAESLSKKDLNSQQNRIIQDSQYENSINKSIIPKEETIKSKRIIDTEGNNTSKFFNTQENKSVRFQSERKIEKN